MALETTALDAMLSAPIKLEIPIKLKEWEANQEACLALLARFTSTLKNPRFCAQYCTMTKWNKKWLIELPTTAEFMESLEAAFENEDLQLSRNPSSTLLITILGD